MSSLSRLPSGEPSSNIYELLSVKANLLIKRSLQKKKGTQIARHALSQNLSVKAWEPSNMSINLSNQRQSHIHKLPNSNTSHSQETSAYNLSKLCYSIIRCTWHFQASSPQHTQMLKAIHGLFSQQKCAHSLSTKGTKSFSRYKLQTIYILEVQINFSFQNTKIYIQISYMFVLYINANYVN